VAEWLAVLGGDNVSTVGLLATTLLALAIAAFPGLRKRRAGTGAQWATLADIRRSGAIAGRGIVLGRWGRNGRILRSGGEGHVMLAAPTRSGKGVGFVIPNLLEWPGSVVVLDVKGENHRLTAGWRARHGHAVYRFDPGARETHRWNPLAYVSTDPALRERDLKQIATSMYPTPQAGERFWIFHARELFVGTAMLCQETGNGTPGLGEIQRLLGLPELRAFIRDEVEPRSNGLSQACVSRLLSWAETDAAATRAGILATAQETLLAWNDPILDRATAGSDFDLRELRHRPMAIYVTVSPQALISMAPVLRVFFEQVVQLNATDGGPGRAHEVLLMLDEFPAFGRIETIEKGIAYVASYGLRLCVVAQSEAQLRSIYGRDGARVLVDNCASRIYFAPNGAEEASAISRQLGTRLVNMRTLTSARSFLGKRSVAITPTEKPLLSPYEIRELGAENAIVLMDNCRPILARKIRWYSDSDYRCRHVPIRSDDMTSPTAWSGR